MKPTAPNERVTILDTLRGFALLGVLLVNVHMLGQTTDDTALFFLNTFATAKFYALFSFLFGYGLVLFIDRAEARGARGLVLMTRRLVILAGIGALHVALGWRGDILILYAIVGGVAVWFRHAPPRVLFSVALTAVILPILWDLLPIWLGVVTQGAAVLATPLPQSLPPTIYATGSFAEITAQRITDYLTSQRLTTASTVLGYMLAGMWAERVGLFCKPNIWGRVILWALPFGVLGGLVYAASITAPVITWGLYAALVVGKGVSAPALAVAYVGMIYHAPQWVANLLAPVGRLALTNYLLQTAVLTFVFYGYGLGLYGSLPTAVGLGLGLAIFGLQIPFSHWWLGRYAYGPVEGVWRRLTYGQVFTTQHISHRRV